MITHSKLITAVLLTDMVALLMYNVSGMCVTGDAFSPPTSNAAFSRASRAHTRKPAKHSCLANATAGQRPPVRCQEDLIHDLGFLESSMGMRLSRSTLVDTVHRVQGI